VIDDRQDPKRPAIGQGIMHEIHAPALSRTGWDRGRATMECDMLASPHPHAQGQVIEPVQSSNAFPIHLPALATQEHPDAQIPKTRARMGQIANPYPQRGLTLRAASSIPGGTTEPGQPTGPQATDLKRLLKPGGEFSAAGGP